MCDHTVVEYIEFQFNISNSSIMKWFLNFDKAELCNFRNQTTELQSESQKCNRLIDNYHDRNSFSICLEMLILCRTLFKKISQKISQKTSELKIIFFRRKLN